MRGDHSQKTPAVVIELGKFSWFFFFGWLWDWTWSAMRGLVPHGGLTQ